MITSCLSLGLVGSTESYSRSSAVVMPFLAVTRCGPADAGGTFSRVSPDKLYTSLQNVVWDWSSHDLCPCAKPFAALVNEAPIRKGEPATVWQVGLLHLAGTCISADGDEGTLFLRAQRTLLGRTRGNPAKAEASTRGSQPGVNVRGTSERGTWKAVARASAILTSIALLVLLPQEQLSTLLVHPRARRTRQSRRRSRSRTIVWGTYGIGKTQCRRRSCNR